MSHVETKAEPITPDPLPENITSIQPGGGVCYQIELAWGRLRRGLLRRFRPAYVRRMEQCRIGTPENAPHDILDPRDLKYCRNQTECHWAEKDDRFVWREKIPFARWGLAELQLMGYPALLATIAAALILPSPYGYLAILPGIVLLLIVYFFRDPSRPIPQGIGQLVSPADGKIAEITELEYHDFIDGPAVRIGIFLSIFNVHINRAPDKVRVLRLHYSPGEFLNALDPESAIRNENMWIGIQQTEAPQRKMVVRQIAGLIARRIVCDLKPGEELSRGHKFGMIKLGSRTELIIPRDAGLEITVQLGQKVKAGSTIFAQYSDDSHSDDSHIAGSKAT